MASDLQSTEQKKLVGLALGKFARIRRKHFLSRHIMTLLAILAKKIHPAFTPGAEGGRRERSTTRRRRAAKMYAGVCAQVCTAEPSQMNTRMQTTRVFNSYPQGKMTQPARFKSAHEQHHIIGYAAIMQSAAFVAVQSTLEHETVRTENPKVPINRCRSAALLRLRACAPAFKCTINNESKFAQNNTTHHSTLHHNYNVIAV